MKSILFLALLLQLTVGCKNQKENESLKEENSPVYVWDIKTKDGIGYYQGKPYTGNCIDIYNPNDVNSITNPKIKGEVGYRNGLTHGQIKMYYENGQVQSITNFVDGKKNGVDMMYSENGRIIYKADYFDDKQEGESFQYDDSGNLIYSRIYKNGIKIVENGHVLDKNELEKNALEEKAIESYIDSAYDAQQ